MPHIIPRPLHALLDYSFGIAALASPKIFRFEAESTAKGVMAAMGGGAIAYSIVTRYEGGLFKCLPFNLHLKVDALSALLGVAAPFVLGFAENKRARNTVLAFVLVEVIVVMLTQPDKE